MGGQSNARVSIGSRSTPCTRTKTTITTRLKIIFLYCRNWFGYEQEASSRPPSLDDMSISSVHPSSWGNYTVRQNGQANVDLLRERPWHPSVVCTVCAVPSQSAVPAALQHERAEHPQFCQEERHHDQYVIFQFTPVHGTYHRLL